MSIATYTKSGAKASTPIKLDKNVFGIEVTNHEVLHRAYVAFLANGRRNLAVTLKRGQVSGGGKKPWRQKGTGRARFGSSRNPIWRGGGIAFGPTGEENYSKKLPASTKHLALRQALSLAAKADRIAVIEDMVVSSGKSKDVVSLLKKVNAPKTTLIVVENKSDQLDRAVRNVSGVQLKQFNYLSVPAIMDAGQILFTKAALEATSLWLKEKK